MASHVHLTALQSLRENTDRFLGSREVCDAEFVVPALEGGVDVVRAALSPALLTHLKEMLDNAIDQVAVDEGTTCISAGAEGGTLVLRNNGAGMTTAPVNQAGSSAHGMVTAEACASVFDFTSKTALHSGGGGGAPSGMAGKNGVGMKGVNGTSTSFAMDTVCVPLKQRFQATWTGGMSQRTRRSLTACARKTGYTQFTWTPDAAFLCKGGGVDASTLGQLYKSMVWSRAAVLQDRRSDGRTVRVEWAEGRSPAGKWAFQAVPWKSPAALLGGLGPAWSARGDGCAMCVAASSAAGAHRALGFVNNMPCNSGTHMRAAWGALRDVVKRLWSRAASAGTPAYDAKYTTPSKLARVFSVVVQASVPSPTYSSQDKADLRTPSSTFWDLPGAPPLGSGAKAGALQLGVAALQAGAATDAAAAVLRQGAKATAEAVGEAVAAGAASGDAVKRIVNVKNYTPASWAGTSKRGQCVLVLAEGASAKTYCMTLRGSVPRGAATMGVYQLKGVPINASKDDAACTANDEMVGLAAILGAKFGGGRGDVKKLRYSQVWVAADMDTDGNHIFALLYNNVHVLWPWIFQGDPVYMKRYITPLVRSLPGTTTAPVSFHSTQAANAWLASLSPAARRGAKLQHVKGLGQWRRQDIVTLHAPRVLDNVVAVRHTGAGTAEWLRVAFAGDSGARKAVMSAFDDAATVDYAAGEVDFPQWAGVELVAHMWAHVQRNVPTAGDGLCPTQRKIIWGIRQLSGRPTRTDTVAGEIVRLTCYGHSKDALETTLCRLACCSTGVANVAVVGDEGAFGSRFNIKPASTRYTQVYASAMTRAMFPPAFAAVVPRVVDDGNVVESLEVPCPLPYILVNGRLAGIGTGYSSTVIPLHWGVLFESVRAHLDGAPAPFAPLDLAPPCFDGTMCGAVEVDPDDASVTLRGRVAPDAAGASVHIQDLPPGKWTGKYVEDLKLRVKSGKPTVPGGLVLRGVEDASTDELVSIRVHVEPSTLTPLLQAPCKHPRVDPATSCLPPHLLEGATDTSLPDLERALGLVVKLKRDNMHFVAPADEGGSGAAGTSQFKVVKYATVSAYASAWAARTAYWYALRQRWDTMQAHRAVTRQRNLVRFICESRRGRSAPEFPEGAFAPPEIAGFGAPLPPMSSLRERGALSAALSDAGYAPDSEVATPPTPTVQSALPRDAVEADAPAAAGDTYTYLTSAPISQQSEAALARAVAKLVCNRAALAEATRTSYKDLWRADLDVLQASLQGAVDERRALLCVGDGALGGSKRFR
jgi:DNA gyrase/topoisomerase IV subunit B